MSEPPAAIPAAPASDLEAPSGKGAGDENFPVGSVLIAPRLRPCVFAFYAYARAADDIADAHDLSPAEKTRRLDGFEAALDRTDDADGKPARLKRELAALGLDDRHARQLLVAFRQDALKRRYGTMEELLDYCHSSADPVGRFLLDIHGEAPRLYLASDALCTALQILNHLQDCRDDLIDLDRAYVPQDWLTAEGIGVESLAADRASPELRRVLDRCLTVCDDLLVTAAELAPSLRSRRLAAETAVIHSLARRLADRLKAADPLATRVKLSKLDFAAAALKGIGRLIGFGTAARAMARKG